MAKNRVIVTGGANVDVVAVISHALVAFGIVALMLTFVVEDGAGGADLLEEKAGKLANVSGVEVVSMDRL